ncbi:MAG: hypothetical protein J5I81_02320 [Nitrococcus mobilis]|nr:hypothetical protein [Nitrococcus mobilis]
MRLNTNPNTRESTVETPVRTSSIKATAQMFKILSSQIYNEKELAIVRELLANAWDAHVSAGTIEIHRRGSGNASP